MIRPHTAARWFFSIAATAGLLLVMVRASAAPVSMRNAESARLRLSWSARPERIETCRTLSAAELEEREEHMRQRVECEGRFATYALRVTLDGQLLHQSVVRGAGFRHDRPLYVLREVDVTPGTHRIRISFARREKTDNDASAFARVTSPGVDTGLFAGRAEREGVEHERRARAAIPASLALDTTLTFTAGNVIIASLDPEHGTLQVLSGAK